MHIYRYVDCSVNTVNLLGNRTKYTPYFLVCIQSKPRILLMLILCEKFVVSVSSILHARLEDGHHHELIVNMITVHILKGEMEEAKQLEQVSAYLAQYKHTHSGDTLVESIVL